MDEIKGVARAKIRPGKLDEYKRLCEQARRLDQEGLIGATISAVDTPEIAIALFGRAEER